MGAKQKADAKWELTVKRQQLTQARRQIVKLDRLFKRIYKDNINGKPSDSRFQMPSDDYEQEQKELREKLLQLNEEINRQEEQAENIERFISKVHEYLDIDELTSAVLNDMVKAVYVHISDPSNGHREQQIDISYDLAGILPASLLNDLQNGGNGIANVTPFPKNKSNTILWVSNLPFNVKSLCPIGGLASHDGFTDGYVLDFFLRNFKDILCYDNHISFVAFLQLS